MLICIYVFVSQVRILNVATGQVLLVSHHPGKNPYEKFVQYRISISAGSDRYARLRYISASAVSTMNNNSRRPMMNGRGSGSEVNNEDGVDGGGGGHQQQRQQQQQPNQRNRSRTLSNLSHNNNNNNTPPPFSSSFSTNRGGSGSGGGAGSNSSRISSGKFLLDKNEKLLRLNVGGMPYDVVRTSLP